MDSLMRQPLIAGNWKMHGTRDSCRALASAIAGDLGTLQEALVAIFPPYPSLPEAAEAIRGTGIAPSFVIGWISDDGHIVVDRYGMAKSLASRRRSKHVSQLPGSIDLLDADNLTAQKFPVSCFSPASDDNVPPTGRKGKARHVARLE